MKKDLLLLLSLMLLLSVSAIAGPRSYQQAKAIAQRQAAMLGIEMDGGSIYLSQWSREGEDDILVGIKLR